MKLSKIKLVLFIFSFFFLFTVFCSNAEARTISISKHTYKSTINSNGSIDIKEYITFDFSGKYNGVFHNVSYNKASSISNLKIFRVNSENNITLLQNNYTANPETYEKTDTGQMVKIKLYSPSQNTQKTYLFTYTIHDVINKYNDVGEFYWKFISNDNETPNNNIEIIINLPDDSRQEDLRVFGHGPLTGDSDIIDDNTVRLRIPYLPPRNFIEARLLFSPELISDSYPKIDKNVLSSILEEEGSWASRANETRRKAREYETSKPISNNIYRSHSLIYKILYSAPFKTLTFIILLLINLFIYFRYLRQPKPFIDYDYYRDLPGNYSPAEMSVLVNGKISTKDISSTILDLVRRKHLIIEQDTFTDQGLFFSKEIKNFFVYRNVENPLDNMKEHERFLINWFIDDLGMGGRADFHEIQDSIKDSKSKARKFRTKFSEWSSIVKNEAIKDSKLIEKTLFRKIPFIFKAITITMIFGGFFVTAFNMFPIILSVLIFNKSPRTPYGNEQYYKWKAFRRYLKDFSMLDEATVPSLIIWEHYLVYAVSLGVAEEVIEQLKLKIPAEEFENGNLTYLNSNNSFMNNNAFSSFNDFVSDINSSAIANSRSSSSSGHGGGFSSGGGGGGFGGGGSSSGGF